MHGKLHAESFGAQVDDQILLEWGGLEPEDDRAVPLAALAMEDALAQSGPAEEGHRTGLSIGTALGAVGRIERSVDTEGTQRQPLSARALREDSFESYANRLARALGAFLPRGEPIRTQSFSVTCVSGLYALEQVSADLALGRVDRVLTGGVDTLTAFMHGGFRALGALSPTGRLLPFDVDHDGILIGEAAAFLAVEPLSVARARGGPAGSCVVSQRLVSDAVHLTSPEAEGKGMARAIEGALGDAALAPEEIGCVTVTATGSAVYDRMQSRAIHRALGDRVAREVPVTTWEPAIGHVLAATGTLGIAYAAVTVERGEVLPVFNVRRVDPECRLRYLLDDPVRLEIPSVLALTVGFGGQNGATVVTSAPMAADLVSR
jgi:3-oxoacyl-[acyl-carrier-protein] synthase II